MACCRVAFRATNDGENATAVSALRDLLIRGLRVALKGCGHAISDSDIEDFAQEGLLRFAELSEMPVDQIAVLLRTNRNAAYKLVHDARRALKRHLHDAGITAQGFRIAFNQ